MRYVLDTHALVWHLANDPRLGAKARQVLDDESNLLVVPVIVLAEAKHIADRRRVPMSFSDILRAVLDSPRCTVFPLDVFTLAHLPEHFDIHDSLIVATALYCRELFNEDVAILTNDVAITQSAVVPVVW